MQKRILIFLFGDLGDTLLTIPAIRAVRRRYPDARLIILSKPLPASIVTQLGLVDCAIVVDKHIFDRPQALLTPRAWLTMVRLFVRLRAEDADTAVIFHHLVTRWGTIKFALLSLASGAHDRIGLDNGRGWFLTRSVRDEGFGAMHEAEYMLEVARLIGAEGDLTLEAPVRAEDRAAIDRLLGSAGPLEEQIVAVHPGTGPYAPGRRWSAEGFARAASIVMRGRPMTCIVLGTDVEAEAAVEVVKHLGSRAVNLVGKTTVGELAALLERCCVLLANDGGVAHLAAAVGTPVVTVFGPSNDRAWRPIGGAVVAANLPCRPCFYRGFDHGLRNGCATRECLSLVSPRTVADAALALIDARHVAV